MDALQARVTACVEQGAARGEPPLETFASVHAMALAAADRPHSHVPRSQHSGRVAPRLTESWFC
jgi:hypothetical protein